MADAISDLSGKLGLDTTDFKTAIAGANRELRVIESGFRASAAALGDWSKDASGLELRIQALTDKMGIQAAKVAALRGEYERIAQAEGANSNSAKEMEIRLNKEVEALGKMQNELEGDQKALDEMGKASNEAGDQVKDLAKKQDEAAKSAVKFGDVMKGLGTALKAGAAAVAGLVLSLIAVGGAIAGLVLSSADAAGELVDLSNQTGISTTRLQELQYAGDQLGVSVETMTGSMSRLVRTMDSARGGTGPAAEAFAALGVSVTDSNGNLRDSEAVFADVLDALGKVPSEADRDALAMQIFGKSAQELNPLIKAGADEIANLSKEAHEMGAVMSEEAVGALESFGDELAGLKAGLKGTLGELAVAFLPAFQGLTGAAKTYLGEFSEIVRGADGDLVKMAAGIGGLIGRMVTDIASQAPQLLQAGLSILQGIGGAILSALPTLIPAVVQMISSLVGFLIQALPLLMDAGVQILLALVNGIVPQLPMLIEAGVKMIITLVEGLAAALPALIPVIADVIPRIVIILIDNLPLLIDAALKLIVALVEGLVTALPILISYVPKIVKAIFDALIAALPLIAKAAGELIGTLALGLIGAIPTLLVSVQRLGTEIVTGILGFLVALQGAGGKLVEGLWDGIVGRWNWLKDQFLGLIRSLIQDAWNAITGGGGGGEEGADTSSSSSSSSSGLSSGISNAINNALASAQASLQATVNGMAPALAGAQAGAAPISITIQATVADDVDIERLATRVVDQIQRLRYS